MPHHLFIIYLESKLSTIVVHSTTKHQTQNILNSITGQNSFSYKIVFLLFLSWRTLQTCYWTNPSIGQSSSHDCHTGGTHLHGACLEVKIQNTLDFNITTFIVGSTIIQSYKYIRIRWFKTLESILILSWNTPELGFCQNYLFLTEIQNSGSQHVHNQPF